MENTAKKGNVPTHNVVIGEDRQVGRKIVTYWTKVGAAWAHDDGKLFIRIRPGLSVSGQIAVFPIEAEKEEADAEQLSLDAYEEVFDAVMRGNAPDSEHVQDLIIKAGRRAA